MNRRFKVMVRTRAVLTRPGQVSLTHSLTGARADGRIFAILTARKTVKVARLRRVAYWDRECAGTLTACDADRPSGGR